jgi:hypothetical protein
MFEQMLNKDNQDLESDITEMTQEIDRIRLERDQ